jgi:hypothetical protein
VKICGDRSGDSLDHLPEEEPVNHSTAFVMLYIVELQKDETKKANLV